MTYSTFARKRIAPAIIIPDRQPTAEQTHILDLARSRDNLQIRALAGTGKTTTLEMLEKVVREKPILYLVFNRKNAKEAEGRMAATTTVRTLNALGHRIWAKVASGNLVVDPKKSQNIFKGIVDEAPKKEQPIIWETYWQVIQGVALAKALGYIPENVTGSHNRLLDQQAFHHYLDEAPDDLTSALIDEVLKRSIVAGYAGNIDYNDQCYLPALFSGTYPQFPLVLVDEAQDLSPVNHAMLHKLCTKSRLIFVGDPWQNIYGFRGAKAGSMESLAKIYSATPADLSVSFRCPQAIVENARWRVPHFQWIKEGGHVESLTRMENRDFPDTATIICRNNAPLFATGFRLLASGHSVTVAGSDIGPKLIGLMRKLGPGSLTRAQTISAINDWLEDKLERESKTALDMAECMRVFANQSTTLDGAIAYAEDLFKQTGTITLTTGHKAKGLEWDTVYHLDEWLLDTSEQDLNLRYVIQTRSKDRYFEIASGAIKW